MTEYLATRPVAYDSYFSSHRVHVRETDFTFADRRVTMRFMGRMITRRIGERDYMGLHVLAAELISAARPPNQDEIAAYNAMYRRGTGPRAGHCLAMLRSLLALQSRMGVVTEDE
jgi:hypothetical protein